MRPQAITSNVSRINSRFNGFYPLLEQVPFGSCGEFYACGVSNE